MKTKWQIEALRLAAFHNYSEEVAVDCSHFHECYTVNVILISLYRLAGTGITVEGAFALANALKLDKSLRILE